LIKDEILLKLGYDRNFVIVEILDDLKFPAFSIGINIEYPIGKIQLCNELIEKLTIDELKFVIAHECIHIVKNHLIFDIEKIYNLIKSMLETLSLIFFDSLYLGFILLKIKDIIDIICYVIFKILPFHVEITKEQEIQADIEAIIITKNKTSAISCLKKIANDDLDAPSHTWEVLNVKFPVMTMRERIDEILRRTAELEKQGFTFA